MGSTKYGPAVDMWSVGCIFAELLNRKPILPGKNELEQLNKIFELCGSPDESNWPGVSKLPWYHQFKPERPMKRRVKEVFKHFDRHALELVDQMLTLDPSKRISAKDALDAEYFWTDPLPCSPSSLPKYESSHEFQTKKKRQQQRQQHDEMMAKRQKLQHPQPHGRLPPIQQQAGQGHNMPMRGTGGANQPGGHNTLPIAAGGPSHHYGGQRGVGGGGPQPRHQQGGRPSRGGQSGYGNPPPQGVGAAGVSSGYGPPPPPPPPRSSYGANGNPGYPQAAFVSGSGRGPAMGGAGRGQQYGVPNPQGMPQPPAAYGGQPYMPQQGMQYADMDGAYGRPSAHSGYALPAGSPHRPDYRQQQR